MGKDNRWEFASSDYKTQIKNNIKHLVDNRLVNNPIKQVSWKSKFKSIGIIF